MKENIKSLLLVALVISTVLLSRMLWLELPGVSGERQNDNGVLFDDNLARELISADKTLIHFKDEKSAIIHDSLKDELWSELSDSLTAVLSSRDVSIMPMQVEDFYSLASQRGVEFRFGHGISPRVILNSLGGYKVNQLQDICPVIDGIYVYLGVGDPFFVFFNEVGYKKVTLSALNLNTLSLLIENHERENDVQEYYSMREYWRANNDVYLSFDTKEDISRAYIKNERVPFDRVRKAELAEQIFQKNISYLREVTDSDNMTLFVYEQTALKIFENGRLEYFAPLDHRETQPDIFASISTLAGYLKLIGEEKNLSIKNIYPIEIDGSYGYRIELSMKLGGIPVTFSNGATDYISAEVFNKQLRALNRRVGGEDYVLSEPLITKQKILSGLDVINNNGDRLVDVQKQYMSKYFGEQPTEGEQAIDEAILLSEMLNNLKEIRLGYFDSMNRESSTELTTVWIVKIANEVLYFDAYSGKEIVLNNE